MRTNSLAGRAANALSGRIRRDQLREILFQLLQLAKKLVVFVVGDELPAFDVIRVVMPSDFVGEFDMAFAGLDLRHAEHI